MSWLHALFLGAVLAWFSVQDVHASFVSKGAGGVGLSRSGANTARGTIKPTGSDFDSLIGRPANLSGGKSDFEALLEMPFKLSDLPPDKGTVKGVITPANIGKALRGGIGGYVAGEAFKRLTEAACVRLAGGSMQPIPSGAWEECVVGQPSPQSSGVEYKVDWAPLIQWHPTKEAACAADMAYFNGSQAAGIGVNYSVVGDVCNYRINDASSGSYLATSSREIRPRASSCPAGKYVWSDGSCHDEPQVSDTTWRPITTDQAQQKFEDAIKSDANKDAVWDALRDYWNKGGQIEIDQPLSVTGPAQSSASTTTTQTTQQTSNGPETHTTTSTTVINYNYAGDTVTVNQTTTNVTRNQAGDVVSTSTTTSAPQPTEEAPTDTALPPVPDLYVRKYPNGMEGIYDEYKDQLKNTSLVQLASQLMPQVGDGGTCPSWPLNMNLATWAAYGVHDVAPPCWIWGVAKAILILSALLLARALIFGG
ncbi:hypothetical protein ABIC89_000813 [Variovorax boronicumulans]|uniref:hypothetical protein n=1 Tax=Variovorax boronicumulans TaxID=436515 RepID=UPI00339687BA